MQSKRNLQHNFQMEQRKKYKLEIPSNIIQCRKKREKSIRQNKEQKK